MTARCCSAGGKDLAVSWGAAVVTGIVAVLQEI